ncbi:hypothetical protein WH47_07857 [Habropoda laboriosa]|uniref:Uncharacterized protein n=1 Tax=Habropoda laboriosa TaxID=597456 RepID=A0A0L7RFR0_9HYME|nr:hypothetical protein WH47_07857 [Habropoda laboriosa]
MEIQLFSVARKWEGREGHAIQKHRCRLCTAETIERVLSLRLFRRGGKRLL